MEKTTPTYNHLCLLKALCEEQNLGSAATRMKIPTSTASRWLTEMRTMFDDKLFTRFTDGLIPTRRALEICEQANAIIIAMDSMLAPKTFDVTTVTREVRIGCVDNAIFSLFPHLAEKMLKKSPGITLNFMNLQHDRFNQLRTGELDLFVSPVTDVPPDFHTLVIGSNDYVLATGPHHPLVEYAKKNGEVPDDVVTQYDCVDICFRVHAGGDIHTLRESAFPAFAPARAAVKTNLFLPIVPSLQNMDLTMVLPRKTASTFVGFGNIAVIPTVTKSVKHKPQIIWHERTHTDPVMQWVRAIILDATQSED